MLVDHTYLENLWKTCKKLVENLWKTCFIDSEEVESNEPKSSRSCRASLKTNLGQIFWGQTDRQTEGQTDRHDQI